MWTVTLEIVRWREKPTRLSGWDGHLTAELKRRLRRALNGAPRDLRGVCRRILNRECVVLENLREDTARDIRHIVEAMGAEVAVRDSYSHPG
jgi:hypothetical protein